MLKLKLSVAMLASMFAASAFAAPAGGTLTTMPAPIAPISASTATIKPATISTTTVKTGTISGQSKISIIGGTVSNPKTPIAPIAPLSK